MARPTRQSIAKRQREQAKREKRERKQEKKAAAAAARSGEQAAPTDTEPGEDSTEAPTEHLSDVEPELRDTSSG
jgi:hypothetical protein